MVASDVATQLSTPVLSRFQTGYFIGEANSGTGDGRGEFDELVFFNEEKPAAFVAALSEKYNSKN